MLPRMYLSAGTLLHMLAYVKAGPWESAGEVLRYLFMA